MSLATMNKEQLHGIARALLIEVPEDATKNEILAKFAEEEVKKEDYENLEIPPVPSADTPLVNSPTEGIVTTTTLQNEAAATAAPEPVANATGPAIHVTAEAGAVAVETVPDKTLLKYDRKNSTFEILTYKFSLEHPFQLVANKDADYIVRNIPGFRPALASEAQEFYS